MNFLELVNRTRLECGDIGQDLTTTVGQSGVAQRYVVWVKQAWQEIQTADESWDWMRHSFSFPTVSQQGTYTPTEAGITSFATWKPDSCRCYVTAVGPQSEMYLDNIPYDVWRNTYQFGSFRTTYTRPLSVSVTPDKQLAIGPLPDSTGYTINGEYFLAPADLVADTDTPGMPDRFHVAIVYRAMMSYAAFEAAPEVLMRGQEGYRRTMMALRLAQQPQIAFAGALA